MLLQLLLLYFCDRTSSAGYVAVQLPYANPAGINYINGQTHYQAGLLAGPVRYPVAVAASPAHHTQNFQVIGTPSYYSYNLPAPVPAASYPFHVYNPAAVTPVVYGAAHRPSVVAVAPQPVHPVVTQYHTPAVHPVHIPPAHAAPGHIPVVAVTPVTPVAPVAPATTTVTKTITREEESFSSSTQSPIHVIKSRKYKVRRPAIQNQFYDIEERVIVRPVGTALVELEHPVSKTQTSVRTHAVQTKSSAADDGYVVSSESTVTQRPQIVQTHTVYHQPPVQQVPVYSPHPVIIHSSNAGHVPHPVTLPSVQTPVYVNHVQPVYVQTTTVPSLVTFKPSHVTYPAVSTPTSTTIPTPTSDGGVDYDDSIVVEARGGVRTLHEPTSTQTSHDYSTTPAKYRNRQCNDYEDVNDPPKRGDIAITYATEETHQSLSREDENSTLPTTTENSNVLVNASFKNVNINARFAAKGDNQSQSIIVRNEQKSQPRSEHFSETTVASAKVLIASELSADQARSNQEQFIRLLSERDSISEVAYGPHTDTSSSLVNTYVRSRVLSATPAPHDARGSSKTVNIRRIIVSRPIETEQEIEVREHGLDLDSHDSDHQIASSSEQVPVYTKIKPPAFADDQAK
ncbi:uncharacterized protein LOC128744121 [Sabethes cyaneus]|uniref:uncharacterized protein LOC128744121 n=1 Tax=Sabethes cyaneus TaxID=53552 RepID=UPI00237DAB37|nr:uncharacterized protein LOC128744121 [Sabethes cyaneus]